LRCNAIRRFVLPCVFLVTLIAVTLGSCRKAPPTLGLLVWEGYADPSFVRAFEEKYQCKVSASYMGSDRRQFFPDRARQHAAARNLVATEARHHA
jgi:spermidine/putrescine-binding protein